MYYIRGKKVSSTKKHTNKQTNKPTYKQVVEININIKSQLLVVNLRRESREWIRRSSSGKRSYGELIRQKNNIQKVPQPTSDSERGSVKILEWKS